VCTTVGCQSSYDIVDGFTIEPFTLDTGEIGLRILEIATGARELIGYIGDDCGWVNSSNWQIDITTGSTPFSVSSSTIVSLSVQWIGGDTFDFWNPTPTPTITISPTPTPTITISPTPTPTLTPTPSLTATPTPSPTATPTPTFADVPYTDTPSAPDPLTSGTEYQFTRVQSSGTFNGYENYTYYYTYATTDGYSINLSVEDVNTDNEKITYTLTNNGDSIEIYDSWSGNKNGFILEFPFVGYNGGTYISLSLELDSISQWPS
jgi:hypothetical protein